MRSQKARAHLARRDDPPPQGAPPLSRPHAQPVIAPPRSGRGQRRGALHGATSSSRRRRVVSITAAPSDTVTSRAHRSSRAPRLRRAHSRLAAPMVLRVSCASVVVEIVAITCARRWQRDAPCVIASRRFRRHPKSCALPFRTPCEASSTSDTRRRARARTIGDSPPPPPPRTSLRHCRTEIASCSLVATRSTSSSDWGRHHPRSV